MRSGFLLAIAGIPSPAMAQMLTGFGSYPYQPVCAEGCLRSFSSYMLDCTSMSHDDMMMMTTSPDCLANNTAYLTSVAWCLNTKCSQAGERASGIESLWEREITGNKKVAAKWSYGEALANVNPRPPLYQLTGNDTSLNTTSIVAPTVYLAQYNVLSAVYRSAVLESAYGIAILVASLGMPVALTWLGYLPFMGTFYDKIRPYIVYPSLIGSYQVRSLPYLLGNAPTIGQTAYIVVFFILNVVLSAIEYEVRQPNAWYASSWQEISAYVMYRTGAFAFMLFPVLLFFSSRNNILLWLTNWSHSTFLLLHRWVARVLMLYVVIHSIIGLQIYSRYASTSWWIWGVVATIFTVVITFASGLYVRKGQYELFLISHIVLAVFILVGSWYHLVQWYASMGMYIPDSSGYEVWLYFAFSVWFFDRAARVARMVKAGLRRAKVTELGDGYVRVDVSGLRYGSTPGKHSYVYFPTLAPWRPWENHPFSIIPTHMLQPERASERGGFVESEDAENQKQVSASTTRVFPNAVSGAGITLFIKKEAGVTKFLKPDDNLLVLLDGPYSNNHTSAVLRCDRVLLIGGGIGITGLLPWSFNHHNIKLAWSVKESAKFLVDAVPLDHVADREVRVGSRLAVSELIAEEAEMGWARIGVVVSGPGSLCDDVRAAVAAAGKRTKVVFDLEVDAYSW
ncbi:unnamed protein product [Clonostachys rosea]|uniref:Ferric oxidoreductase domain-containing protein n=1 Tax=Bionectria ochroleuca TaxID=29856 RepID=A0ABY6UGF6_BIOOC|nr:unnamed protein product [Clonostachys rosea]